MAQRIQNPFAYGAYPTDPAWGAVTGNIIEALFGDPQASAQAQMQRQQMQAMDAEARVNRAKAGRMEMENDYRQGMNDPRMFVPYGAEPSAPFTPQVAVTPTAIGGVPIAVSGMPQGAPAVPVGAPVPAAPSGVAQAASGWTWTNPLPGARQTSGFGPRKAPMAGASTNHRGIDLAGGPKPIAVAAGDGTVEFAGPEGKNGNLVVIRHPDGSMTKYAHLAGFNVKKGDTIRAGQPVGGIGRTGVATGDSLHFGYYDPKGNVADPRFILKGGVRAVPGSAQAAAAPSGVAGAVVGSQPIAQVGTPTLMEEPGAPEVDPGRLATTVGLMVMAGYDKDQIDSYVRSVGAFGGDRSQRSTLVFQGDQAGKDFAASREAQINNVSLNQYGGLAEAALTGNIDEVGGTTRNVQDNATSTANNQLDNQTSRMNNQADNSTRIAMNNADNATSRANNSDDNATRVATSEGGAAGGGKPRKFTAADAGQIDKAFDASVPYPHDQVSGGAIDPGFGRMKGTITATAAEYYSSGQASSPQEAVQMAIRAHGVEYQRDSKKWTYSGTARAPQNNQRVVQGNQGGNSVPSVSITNW